MANPIQLSRRRLLQYGGVSLLSPGFLQLLAAQAMAQPVNARPRARACILLFQVGGPYQADTFDPKPNAIAEVRGPFRTVATRVPGMYVTDVLPRLARQTDKIAILRGVHHTIRCHNPAIYCSLVGRELNDPLAVSNRTNAQRTDHPHYASTIARLRPGNRAMPHHVIIPNVTNNGPARSPGLLGGYLGSAYDPLILGQDPNDPDYRMDSFALPGEVGRGRFENRQALLNQLDGGLRQLDREGAALGSMETLYQRAFDLLSTPRARQAFNLDLEPARLRDHYGRHQQGQSALLARRLVEAGVPFVSVFSHTDVDRFSWDTHQNHYPRLGELLPPADQSFAALLEDLSLRGMLDDTLVIWLGEFGRTPRMGIQFSNNSNNTNGRDHWCNCYSVVLAGGGVRGGQILGSSDQIAGYPRERPVHISEIAATLFHVFGIDPRSQLTDIQGQLRMICDGQPIQELF